MSTTVAVLLAIYCVTWTLIGLGLLVGILVVVMKIRQAVSATTRAVQPTLKQVRETVDEVSATARDIAGRARNVAGMAEETIADIRERVRTTADLVQDTVTGPFVSVNSAIAGIRRGFEVWRERVARRAGGDGGSRSEL